MRQAARHPYRCIRGPATASDWSNRTASGPVRRISTAHSQRKRLEAKTSRGDFATRAKPMTSCERDCSSLILHPCGLFQGGNVDLVHFHHRVHDARCFRFIGIGQHIAENDRVDLPGETEFVFEPAAPPGRSAIGGKFLPEIIDLILGPAVLRERDRFCELELRAAVERHEVDSVESKLRRYARACRPANYFRCFFWITGNLPDPRILENADVEFRRLLRLGIEP